MKVIQKPLGVLRYLQVDYTGCIFTRKRGRETIIKTCRGFSTLDGFGKIFGPGLAVIDSQKHRVPLKDVSFVTNLCMVEYGESIIIPHLSSRRAPLYRKGITLSAVDFRIVGSSEASAALKGLSRMKKARLCLPEDLRDALPPTLIKMRQRFSTVLSRYANGEEQPMIIDQDLFLNSGSSSNIKSIWLYQKKVATYNIQKQKVRVLSKYEKVSENILKQLANRGVK